MRYSETVINAFLTNSKDTDIAKACNLSPRTIHTYKKDPELQRILTERRAECARDALSRMSLLLDKGVTAIEEVLDNPESGDQVKINAVNALYNQYQALYRSTCLEARLQRLEAMEEQRL